MTPHDFSQVPVEQLARLLLERARRDPGLPRRTPANSNEAPPGWTVPLPARPCQPWFPGRLAEQPRFAGQDRIEDLVSQAITAAQEAEDIAQATRAASRKANRGAAIAMALGTLGAVAGIGAGAGNLFCGNATPPVQAAAQPTASTQPAAAPAAEITSQADSARPPAVHAGPDESAAATPPALAPATFVRVLPAVPSSPPEQPDVPPPRRLGHDAGFGRVIGAVLRWRAG